MTGRIKEGGIKAGELRLGPGISRLEAGWRKWLRAMGFCGGAAGLGGAGGDR
jgi:hypothetical protein